MKPQGSFVFRIEGDIIISWVYGKWNASLAKQYDEQLKILVPTFNGKPWARLVFFDRWEIGTPEIEPIIRATASWCWLQELACVAYVYDDDALKTYQLNKITQPSCYGQKFQHFGKTQDALEWLNREGFKLDMTLDLSLPTPPNK
jgi:hypothetical protein